MLPSMLAQASHAAHLTIRKHEHRSAITGLAALGLLHGEKVTTDPSAVPPAFATPS
jgi:hypothetical protein